MCGVLLSSPLFLLAGIAAPDGDVVPRLTPASARYPAACEELVGRSPLDGFDLTCSDSGLVVSARP